MLSHNCRAYTVFLWFLTMLNSYFYTHQSRINNERWQIFKSIFTMDIKLFQQIITETMTKRFNSLKNMSTTRMSLIGSSYRASVVCHRLGVVKRYLLSWSGEILKFWIFEPYHTPPLSWNSFSHHPPTLNRKFVKYFATSIATFITLHFFDEILHNSEGFFIWLKTITTIFFTAKS